MHSSRGDVVRRLHKLASKLSFADYMHTLIPLFGDFILGRPMTYTGYGYISSQQYWIHQ
ncbi:Pentatricopeptide repeat-containing protein mitochondrial [Zea mays]|uniref:Pentatricopeptide repeat-containing protein mitochondrial n=1 Tax=Zea mays TaxID=4577 RepID=A0A1D6KUZ0_MAIZE|nr:Pentatricopeptide repeat-containing protein mitochondrial [Zea mays]